MFLIDNQENYNIIQELIFDYAKANKSKFINFFIQGNVGKELGSIELSNYIENIRKNEENVGVIELSITLKIFKINIFVYEEDNPNSNKYIFILKNWQR